jgi:hypothetical protein
MPRLWVYSLGFHPRVFARLAADVFPPPLADRHRRTLAGAVGDDERGFMDGVRHVRLDPRGIRRRASPSHAE